MPSYHDECEPERYDDEPYEPPKKCATEPLSTWDKIILVVVVGGIIAFLAFSIFISWVMITQKH